MVPFVEHGRGQCGFADATRSTVEVTILLRLEKLTTASLGDV